MLRVVLRETLLLVTVLLAVSLVAFVALDFTGAHDWYGTLVPGRRAGVPREQALARDLPMVWNRRVADARVRTLDDLGQLTDPHAGPAARVRLLHRGTAALPTLLGQLAQLRPAAQRAALDVVATMAPALTGGEHPPADATEALAYWDRFTALRGLDFRQAYARRLVQRLADHESRNAAEQLTRLGTFGLPTIFAALDGPTDSEGARRLTDLLSDLTGHPLRIAPDATVLETRDVVDAWRAWWFAERLEYDTMSDARRWAGHVLDTRYGEWLQRAISGRLGKSAITGRPLMAELRERIPRSVFVGGLGGLLATALSVAFGGGKILRARRIGTKLLDLTGALIPGLAAFIPAFVLLTQVCAAPRPLAPHLHVVLQRWPLLAIAVIILVPLDMLWLRRSGSRDALDAVRLEAESWAIESRHPKPIQMLRHGFRVGVASLLAPISLSILPLVLLTLLVEPIANVEGMGALTIASVRHGDAPWLLIAGLTIVPLSIARRWADRAMSWALGQPYVPRLPARAQNMTPSST